MKKISRLAWTLLALSAFSPVWAPADEPRARGEELEISLVGDANRVTTVDFGTIRVRDVAYRTLRLTNNGATDLNDLRLSISGADFYGYSRCGNTLPPGASCLIDLEYRPWMVGGSFGSLYIRGTDTDLRINLYGWATDY